MLAWMDAEAERRTRESGEAWFWSRSRAGVLAQGRDVRATRWRSRSCATTATATRCSCACARTGPACHTGSLSCFAPALWRTIAERATSGPKARTRRSCSTRASPPARRRSARRRSRSSRAALVESRRAPRLGGGRPGLPPVRAARRARPRHRRRRRGARPPRALNSEGADPFASGAIPPRPSAVACSLLSASARSGAVGHVDECPAPR